MKPLESTRERKEGTVTKWYSWPSRSVPRGERVVWEIEKPKREGWAARRRFRRVDLPEPEGPDITIGRGVDAGGGVSREF